MATFVLIHGAFSGGWSWDKVKPYMEKAGHKVLTPDLPGHDKPGTNVPEGHNVQTYAEAVAKLLDKQPEPVILVGHSMGGTVVSQAAEYRPDKVKKLVYVCAFLLRDGESLKDRRGGKLDPLNTPYKILKEQLFADCADEDVRKHIARMVQEPQGVGPAAIHITEENYGRIPRVYITCLRDNAIKPETQQQMYTDTPCERVITMDTSHAPLLAKPKELAENLLSVLED